MIYRMNFDTILLNNYMLAYFAFLWNLKVLKKSIFAKNETHFSFEIKAHDSVLLDHSVYYHFVAAKNI